MSAILDQVQQAGDQFVAFSALFDAEEGRGGVVVTFLAVMELIKESLLEIIQTEAFAPIHVKARTPSEGAYVDEGVGDEYMVDEQMNDEP
jgi:segregation and condensation protein A